MRADLPTVDADTRPFWDAARERRLLIQRCGACGEAFHYPRPFCPRCWSEDVAWVEAGGGATLTTWSVVHRNDLAPFRDRVPYIAAIVDLAEGPRLQTEVVGCDPADLRIGMTLQVDFEDRTEELTLPVFRPATKEL